MDNKGNNKFNVPEGYFSGFNERLKARIAAEEEPRTDFLPISDGFSTPSGYFNNTYPRLKKRLDSSAAPKVVPLWTRKLLYYAAGIALVFGLSVFWKGDAAEPIGFDDLGDAEIEAYLEQAGMDLSTDELTLDLSLSGMSLLEGSESATGDALMDYLDGKIEDLDDLELSYEEL